MVPLLPAAAPRRPRPAASGSAARARCDIGSAGPLPAAALQGQGRARRPGWARQPGQAAAPAAAPRSPERRRSRTTPPTRPAACARPAAAAPARQSLGPAQQRSALLVTTRMSVIYIHTVYRAPLQKQGQAAPLGVAERIRSSGAGRRALGAQQVRTCRATTASTRGASCTLRPLRSTYTYTASSSPAYALLPMPW